MPDEYASVILLWEDRNGLFIIDNNMSDAEFITHLIRRIDRIENRNIEQNGFYQFLLENHSTNEVSLAYIGRTDNQSLKIRIVQDQDSAYHCMVQSYSGWQLFLIISTIIEASANVNHDELYEDILNVLIQKAKPTCKASGDYPVSRNIDIINKGDCGLLEEKYSFRL